ncbi:DJ-1/PfpI family protein [Actinomadura rifamycini]|uniref:DJ-1/PfpI family protein n=1 Tax=Actinomadura rifamycini TaxID=31962 RepID=UPI0004137895|nr:DJ-1/PfpI family protein [Actinomadura rifamycini]
MCTGAFLLHAAGPARGRRVATHRAWEDELERRGDVTVVRDARYVVDGNLVTSQGVSAGIDMALWLEGRLHGRDHARGAHVHPVRARPALPGGHPRVAFGPRPPGDVRSRRHRTFPGPVPPEATP